MIILKNNYNDKLAYPAKNFTFDQYLVDKSNETYFFSNIIVVDYGYVASGAKYHIR